MIEITYWRSYYIGKPSTDPADRTHEDNRKPLATMKGWPPSEGSEIILDSPDFEHITTLYRVVKVRHFHWNDEFAGHMQAAHVFLSPEEL